LNLTFTRDDRTFQVHLTSIRIDRAFHGVVAVFHDVTELRRLEQVRRDFVANVSHELRTPLTSIKGYTETLMDGALEDASTARKFIASIQHHTTRLQALVEDLLQLSRIESGRIEVRFRPCFLEPIARRVLEALDERCTRKRLTLGFDCRMGLPVRGDDALLELVLFNLLDNAIKYTPEGGSVTLRLFQEQNEGILAVADTGVGIPSEALPRIFERFYRVDRVRSREQGGTGLGLSIVKHTMDRLQGRVWVESAVGSGSTFYIALPVWQEGPEEAKEPSGATPHQSPEGP
jgi:two-component system phosphate regulon sensor histidine kinase PhoR